ncbi:hypothetical protein BpJC7_15030 [Weizmannia acidilactici]|uniref:Uncharacterized protein n=1 Tax=Weizmannia acidilactici TaxID=2607726 RepID=A0A5J4JI39_9BACI|nr:hypothetical protein [Weizmannia acidilactici]GER70200.1 hypothetical protein BpJC7_15030 [Weizmannia acidilactici]GER73240.1 hypothetical protein BpPP18_13070 [Weizmannia acidilactici]
MENGDHLLKIGEKKFNIGEKHPDRVEAVIRARNKWKMGIIFQEARKIPKIVGERNRNRGESAV